MVKPFFPISFWSGPELTPEAYQEAIACGFNVIPIQEKTPDRISLGLDMAHQGGIKGLVVDGRIHPGLPDQPGWSAIVRAVVNDYQSHPALYGYLLTDEPHQRQFENLHKLVNEFKHFDPEHIAFINLFPNYASPDQLGFIDYENYVAHYLDTVKPPVLSYDHYALMEDSDRPQYFSNLEVIRRQALRVGLPFWNVILSTPHFSYRDPTDVDLRWQVYTTLAYGGKGIVYFTYSTLDVENYRNGIIGLYGQKTAKYAIVQQLNFELQRLGSYLMDLKSVAVTHTPEAPIGTVKHTGNGLVYSIEGGQFVIGEFVDSSDHPWLMIVNKDRQRSTWVTLYLKTPLNFIDEVGRLDGTLRPIARDQGVKADNRYGDGLIVRFWLAPADGRLMRLSKQ
jgi:hypothetical protein